MTIARRRIETATDREARIGTSIGECVVTAFFIVEAVLHTQYGTQYGTLKAITNASDLTEYDTWDCLTYLRIYDHRSIGCDATT